MPIWSAATITRVSSDGEAEISGLLKCLIARYSIPIVAATAVYALPNDLLSIRRVTWKGKKREPLPPREYHLINSVLSSGEPNFYVFNQQGRNTIRFHPIPNVTLAAGTDLFGGHPLSSYLLGGVSYLRFTAKVSENFTSGVVRKGKSDVVLKFNSSGKKITAYKAVPTLVGVEVLVGAAQAIRGKRLENLLT